MESAFPRGDGRFEVIPVEREEELICEDIDEAVKRGWNVRLGDLYGVVRRRRRKGGKKLAGKQTVRVPGKCEIPRGYGTVKGKSWRLRVIKGRPITPHTKHVLRRISRTVARAHHVEDLMTAVQRNVRSAPVGAAAAPQSVLEGRVDLQHQVLSVGNSKTSAQ